MKINLKNLLPNSNPRQLITSLAFCLCILGQGIQPSQAEGSRTLYPNSATGNRANLEWSTDLWGGLIRRRTILKVYAQKDEYILLGSSAVGVGSGDILVFKPGNNVSGFIGDESIPATPDFKCSTQTGLGFISSRAQELAGPKSISGTGNTSGYTPCYYQAPSTGIYDIIFYGPAGGNSPTSTSILPTGEINLTNSSNFDINQSTTIAAWDVTVRSSNQNSTTDINGRLFSYYLSLFTGGNGRHLYFSLYPVTTDGYRYQVDLRGTDPDGFVIYGNQVGFFDSDGKTPLYHDILAAQSLLTTRDGNTSLSRPQYPTFFNKLVDDTVLSFIDRYRADGTFDSTGIPLVPTSPTVNNLKFTGTVVGNTSSLGTGGTFTFNTNVTGNYEIVISRDGSNFDPTNSQNRVLRGVMNTAGAQSVTWNGKDNSGNNFPVGTNYPVKVRINAGEYHFPLLDVENNFYGGPTIKLLNATNSLGNTTAFYDDRGYTTIGGINVGTPGTVLCGGNPPDPAFSNPISGFDSSINNGRKFGLSTNNSNPSMKCAGSFGNTKGLDLWTFFPSNVLQTPVTIVNSGRNIAGTLYEDSDRGNDFDAGEPTLPAGINVKLIRTSDNSVVAVTTTKADGSYIFTNVANDSYQIQVDTTSSNIPNGMSLRTPNNLAVTASGGDVLNQNFGFDVYKVSPQTGKIIINEVLYNETPNNNDEFIELYNASSSSVNLSGFKLADGNLVANDTDSGGGFTYTFPNGTILQPGQYAVIWIGSNNANTQATGAAFQDWVGAGSARLNNTGDDVWLYDSQNQIIDYVAYGTGTGINIPPPSSLNLWDSTYQSSLAGATDGRSISLTRNGNDTNTSACWESTKSGEANGRCPSYLPTRDTEETGITEARVTSVGQNNNGSNAKLLLVKRITRINSTNLTDFVDGQSNVATSASNYVPSPYDTDDNDSKWPSGYLQGRINAGAVQSGDEVEYTIYFLSAGLNSVSNVRFCDLIPSNSTFVATAFNGLTPSDGGSGGNQGIALAVGSSIPTVYFSNAADSDRGVFYAASDSSTPANCGTNTNGAVVVNITKAAVLPSLSPATGQGTPNDSYGFVRFRVKIK